MRRMIAAFPILLSGLVPAHAHWGHVGELAGHGHLIGIGAIVVAGGLAGLLGYLTDTDSDSEESEPGEVPQEAEPAEA